MVDQQGSAGYGRAFREAAIGAWGTKTLDDVKAMAAYIKALPSVDPERVGVMGLSHGGYMTLLALTKVPELFRAGVDLMGPTDRRTAFLNRNRRLHIGERVTEEETLELYDRVSPISSVADLRAPLLILRSDRDRNVAPAQTYAFVDELERHHKPHELVMYPDEAHGLADPEHRGTPTDGLSASSTATWARSAERRALRIGRPAIVEGFICPRQSPRR